MPVKDYYATLRIPQGADAFSIKKAFRTLAMEYHPDKRGENAENDHYFREIKEAYGILSDPKLREEYHYQRWLEKSMGHQLDTFIQPAQILQLFIKAEQYIASTHGFRTDKMSLFNHVYKLFSPARLEAILSENNLTMEETTLQMAMRMGQHLNLEGCLFLTNHFKKMLEKHPHEAREWEKLIRKKKQEDRLEQLKVPLVLVLTLLICFLIFLLGK
jgi:DnaJ-domain-containing protein 1